MQEVAQCPRKIRESRRCPEFIHVIPGRVLEGSVDYSQHHAYESTPCNEPQQGHCERWRERAKQSHSLHASKTHWRDEHQTLNPVRIRRGHTDGDRRTHRVPDQMGAVERKSIEYVDQVSAHRIERVFAAPSWLVGQPVSLELHRDCAEACRGERLERLMKDPRTASPARYEDNRRCSLVTGFDYSYSQAGTNDQKVGPYTLDPGWIELPGTQPAMPSQHLG